jgi:hypothetical protein
MSGDVTVPGVVLGLVGGIGGTVLTELFRLRRAAREEPKLQLELVNGLSPGRVAGNPSAYARLDVANDRRSNGATGVSVRIERVLGGSSEDAEIRDFLEGWQLAWANEDRGNPNVPPLPQTVPADDKRRIDVAHLNSTVHGKLIIDVRPQPNTKLNYVGAGTFTFDLVVSGDNARAHRYAIDIVHDAERWDGEHATAADRVRHSEPAADLRGQLTRAAAAVARVVEQPGVDPWSFVSPVPECSDHGPPKGRSGDA